MAQYDDIPVQRIAVVSVASILVTIVTVLAVQVIYSGMQGRADAVRAASTSHTESEQVLAAQREAISRSGVDANNARLVIPIEQAMREIVRKSGENHEQQSVGSEET